MAHSALRNYRAKHGIWRAVLLQQTARFDGAQNRSSSPRSYGLRSAFIQKYGPKGPLRGARFVSNAMTSAIGFPEMTVRTRSRQSPSTTTAYSIRFARSASF